MTGDDQRDTRGASRFAFGKNWQRFLRQLNEERIGNAEQSLRTMLKCNDLAGRSFLDVGCGSGLFSLAARRLGATVRSFDYDEHSVACCQELKRRYFPNDGAWTIERGSILDLEYVGSLPTFDVVYSWGVLHHTGDMWRAMGRVDGLVAPAVCCASRSTTIKAAQHAGGRSPNTSITLRPRRFGC